MQPLKKKLDLAKLKKFNETLFSTMFNKDVKLSFLNAGKNYMVVPLRLVQFSENQLSYEIDYGMID